MTSTQLIVLALLAAAFVSGWVARGAQSAEDEHAPEVSAEDLLAEASRAHERVIDAWLDRLEPTEPLEDFEAVRARLDDARTRQATPRLDDAAEALSLSAGLFEEYRAGLPLTAATSKHLEDVEARLGPSRE